MTPWFAALVTWWGTVLGVGDADVECLVLGHLDAVRATAFVRADPSLLEQVYASAELRERDAALLRRYADRSLRLEGMAQLRSSCRLVEAAPDRLVLDVVDRLGPARVVDGARTRDLPDDHATRRTVTLTRVDDGWRVLASR